MFTKPIKLSKHAQERFSERARDSKAYPWRKDLTSRSVQRMERKTRNGKKFLHVWTKGNKHYILLEKENYFLVVTIIQKNKNKRF